MRGVFYLLACIVVLATALALMMPAITMTKNGTTAPEAADSTVAVLEAQDEDAPDEELEAQVETEAEPEPSASEDDAADVSADDGEEESDAQDEPSEADDPAADDEAAADPEDAGEDEAQLDADEGEIDGDPEDSEAEAPEAEDPDADDPDTPEMPAQSFYGELRDGNGKVTLTVDVDAPEGALPAGTTMQVQAVETADVRESIEQALAQENAGMVEKVQAVDITFLDAEGEPVEPTAPVNVKLASKQIAQAAKAEQQMLVAHVDDAGTAELIEALSDEELAARDLAPKASEILFDADAFSVYAIVYTVDFGFELNGVVYQFTLKGADAVSLSQLVEALELGKAYQQATQAPAAATVDDGAADAAPEVAAAQADEVPESNAQLSSETQAFMTEVESVEFSNPKLLWVGKIEQESTVAQLLYQHNLVPEYPAGTTDQDYCNFANRVFTAPDWALISLKPFDTTETLMITLKNGDQLVITVTDDADAVLIDDGQGGKVVQTITNPSGTTIDLFDYWITDNLRNSAGMNGWPGHQGDAFTSWQFDHYNYNGQSQYGDVPMTQDPARNNDWYVNNDHLRGNGNNQGINTNHAFKFYPGAAGTVVDYGDKGTHIHGTGSAWTNNHDRYTSLNSWTGDADPTAGLVTNTLVNGYPQLTNNASLGTDGSSLAYLFDGTSHAGKQKYGEVDNILYVDSDGYYTYDSRYYSASYNTAQGDGGDFVLREHDSNASNQAKGFWPFGSRVNWHGMHINSQFSMPANGQVLNPNGEYKNMQFEFSGDDDTWVYIDGVLVGDGGGIHNRTEIDINFATGVVRVTGKEDPAHVGDYEWTSTLREIFQAAGRYNADEFDGDTFKAGTYHTFDMFYLERGGSESNLYIHYNLVSTADFTAHKSYHDEGDSRLERDEFKFELIGLDGRYESVPVDDGQGGTTYVLQPAAWNNGDFNIPQNNKAIMPHSSAGTSGAGTVASPYYDGNYTYVNGSDSFAAQLLRIGVTEDGNVNFGNADISEAEKRAKDFGHASVYRYVIREVVPDAAVNMDGITWAEATEEEKLEGGFTYDGVTYDGRSYYMSARVTSWEETNASGQTVTRYGLSKTYYTDDTFTTPRSDVQFASFVNGYVRPVSLKVVKKSDSDRLLNGATFTLTHAMQDAGGAWVPRQHEREDGTVVTASPRTATTSAGVLTFDELAEGHYLLEETAAPAGYAMGETTKWLLTLSKTDTATRIELVPTITPLNADGTVPEGAEPVTPAADGDYTFAFDVLNGKLPRGDIEVTKQWLRPDGTTAYAADEIAELGEDVLGTTITGELWRSWEAEATIHNPLVTVYARSSSDNTYTEMFSRRIEYGTSLSYSLAVNGTSQQTNVTSTGNMPALDQAKNTNITYSNGITKDSGNVYTVSDVRADTEIRVTFNSNQVNWRGIGYYIADSWYTAAAGETSTGTEPQEERITANTTNGVFTLNSDNNWTITWTAEQLAEHDYDYEYFFRNVAESPLEGFTFIGTPQAITDPVTGKVTFAFKNVKEGEKTDLTVRKGWADGNAAHADGSVTYKIQRAEYDLEGTQETEPYDYNPSGSGDGTFTLSSSDAYNGVAWQRHHTGLPTNNGKDPESPYFRMYRYTVVEVGVPSGYTVSYGTATDVHEGETYAYQYFTNTPVDNKISVEKKWMAPDGTTELTSGIPSGAYITGTLERDYSTPGGDAPSVTVRVYDRSWTNGVANPIELRETYTDVARGTVFSLWAVDANGQEPIHGVTVNDQQISQNGAERTYEVGHNWFKTSKAFTVTANGDIEIVLEWYYNTAYETRVFYEVDYTQASGGTGPSSGTETVGDFRLDAANGWNMMWTNATLNEQAGATYTYRVVNIQEHAADGAVVANYEGFNAPTGGTLTYDEATQKWTAAVVNVQQPVEVDITILKVNALADPQQALPGAWFSLTQVDAAGHDVPGGVVKEAQETGADGTLTFTGLVPGRYKLVETQTPAGYVKQEGDYFINVTTGGADTIDGDPAPTYIGYNYVAGEHVYTVGNVPGSELPHTGGPGTLPMIAFGLLLVLAAAATLSFRRPAR